MATTTDERFYQKDPQKCISQTGFGLPKKPEKKAQVVSIGGKPIFGGPPTFKDYKVPKLRAARSQLKPENKAPAESVGGEPIFGGPPKFKNYNVPKLQGTRSPHQFGSEFAALSFEAIAKNGCQFPFISFAAIAKNGKPFPKPTKP